MNRRGFMQTMFGGVVAGLLPRSKKAKAKAKTEYDCRHCERMGWISGKTDNERWAKGLSKKPIEICNATVDGGIWDCKYFEIKLISNGIPLTCDITKTHDGEGICYTVISGDDNTISMSYNT